MILKLKCNAFNPNRYKSAQLILILNNNHSFQILDEEIVRSITNGRMENISAFFDIV